MGITIKIILAERGSISIPLELTLTQHLVLEAKINGATGRFILDTGASSTCVGIEWINYFQLSAKNSDIKASGAGSSNMETQISTQNYLQIEELTLLKVPLVLFDLSHINSALSQFQTLPIHGIIGADILKKRKAVIDYTSKRLYLYKGKH